jgi:hypothetical protein
MTKSKWIKILTSIGIIFLIVFVVIPPFTRKWYKNHSVKYAPPVPVSNWEKFTSGKGKFSVWFPGTPAQTNQFVTNAIVTAEDHFFYVNPDIQDSYVVVYCDNEKFDDAIKNGKAQIFLEAYESLVVNQAEGKVLFEHETTFENFPSREFEYKAGGKANYSVRVKCIMVGQRVYSVMAVFLAGNPYPEDRETFFNSFRLQEH